MLTYVKPNGKVMEIDEGSVEFAEKLGWTPKQRNPQSNTQDSTQKDI